MGKNTTDERKITKGQTMIFWVALLKLRKDIGM
jgi:hypothetical protein